MSYKMKGFSGFKSPLKQEEEEKKKDDNKCYIDDTGNSVCPRKSEEEKK